MIDEVGCRADELRRAMCELRVGLRPPRVDQSPGESLGNCFAESSHGPSDSERGCIPGLPGCVYFSVFHPHPSLLLTFRDVISIFRESASFPMCCPIRSIPPVHATGGHHSRRDHENRCDDRIVPAFLFREPCPAAPRVDRILQPGSGPERILSMK